MYTLTAFALAVIPSLFLVRYFYRQDNLKPEPKKLIIKIFCIGILATFPVIIIELSIALFEDFFSFHPLAGSAFRAFVIAALTEEFMKFIVVKYFVYNQAAFDEIMDGVVYTVVASLGFACMENIIYVLQGGFTVAIIRALTAVPLHAFASGMMGYFIGKAKFASTKSEEKGLFIEGLAYAILIHGLYDFFLFTVPELGNWVGFLILPLLYFSFRVLKKKISQAKAEDTSENHLN
jgi:RsiW-degrading membrane proteinase PrsW (M82 family)